MKIKTVFSLLICFFSMISIELIAQEDPQLDLMRIFQNYYLNNDKTIVDKTVSLINKYEIEYNNIAPIFEGFYGALIKKDSKIKSQIESKLSTIEKSEFKALFSKITESNIDSIYSKMEINPTFNDMNWSSFFATGDLKFVNAIIDNLKYIDNREDFNLYTAAATAKWSLCANLAYDDVKKHLNKLKNDNTTIADLLIKTLDEIQNEMVVIIKQQRSKGIW